MITEYKKTIIVNGYPLRSSGALQILRQFVGGIEKYSIKEEKYVIFIHPDAKISTKASNIEFVLVKQSNWQNKLFNINFKGINKYLKEKGITPNLIISLGNVDTKVSVSVPHFLYYHQSLTLYSHNWNPFKYSEFSLFVYKYYYKWIVKKSLTNNTTVITQLQCIKDRFSKIFKHSQEKIIIATPSVMPLNIQQEVIHRNIDTNAINIIYAATPLAYKNHKILFESLELIAKNSDKKVTLYLTGEKRSFKYDEIHSENINIEFMGIVPFDELMILYTQMDALVFPSYIESFGLPMIEAAMQGIKIIASDMDFSREVLKDYPGVEYVDAFDIEGWANKIIELNNIKTRFTPLAIEDKDSWKQLFEIFNKYHTYKL